MASPKRVLDPVVLFLLIGCAAAYEGDEAARALELRPLAVPAAAASGEPNLAVGPDGTVYLSWIDRVDSTGHALRYATYTPGGEGWSEARTIAEGDDWFVNWADFPSIVVGADGHLAAHWLARNGQGRYAYGARVSLSDDGGATWSEPRWLHDDNSATEHGFVAMVPLEGGTTLAAWLDGRNYARGEESMTLRARLARSGGTLAEEHLVDGMACDCCPVSAAALPGGGALVAYRDRTEEEIRDIYTVRFDGTTWDEPRRVHADDWYLTGCPVNGPAVDAAGARAAVAWFTAAGDVPRVHVAFSEDGGSTFGEPVRVDLGRPTGRVDAVLLEDGSALVSWIEGEGAGREAGILVRQVTADGTPGEPATVEATTTGRTSGYPRMVRSGSEVVFAWTGVGEARQVRSAVAAL